jgi:hypothetical protein
MSCFKKTMTLSVAGLTCCVVLLASDATFKGSGSLLSTADARVGRPLTPMSYAGVARRTTRRAVAVGTAATVGAAAYRSCRRVANPYGQIVTQCY